MPSSAHPPHRLSADDLKALAQQLEAMRRRALEEIREADAIAAPEREVHDRADEAEGERNDELRMAEIAIDEATVRDIALAEHRLRTGDYGLCLACGQAIPRDRMFAQPTAVRCAACQSDFESRDAA